MNAALIRDACDQLSTMSAHLAGQASVDAQRLGACVLGLDHVGSATPGGHSELNADGWPLQACFTIGKGASKLRLLGDPAWFLGRPAERLTASAAALEDCFTAAGAGDLLPAGRALLAGFAAQPDEQATYQRGFIWLAAGLGAPGAALYLDAKPLGTDAAWDDAARWLAQLLPDAGIAVRIIERLSQVADLVSIGLEGTDGADGRAKLYWRLRAPLPLVSLEIDLLNDPTLGGFLRRAIGTREMALSGTTFSLGFALADGAISDAKIDLCAHCLPQPAESWNSLIDDGAAALGGTAPPLAVPLQEGLCEVANIGLGVDRRGRHRLNLYLKPPGLAAARARAGLNDDLRYRLERATAHLVAIQHADGAWRDYALPVGESSHWVTAFVGAALAEAIVPRRQAAAAAARFLDHNRVPSGGWGFNETTGADADTTGFALRLMAACGHSLRSADVMSLRAHWRPEGGFATYHAADHWGDVHNCVTAAAFAGLPPAEQQDLRPGLLAYLRRTARPDGIWPAYWWRNHLYSTWHHLRLLRRLGLAEEFQRCEAIRFSGVPSSFELAYAAGIEWSCGRLDLARAHLGVLFERQRVDGGWSGGFNLRVTDPSCAQPWDHPVGQLYQDQLGTITTASAIFVMTELLHG